MPPSGYNRTQVNAVRDLLRSCAHDLEREARERDESMLRALQREAEDIRRYLGNGDMEPSQVGILELTRTFYEKVERSLQNSSSGYWGAVDQALDEIGTEVLEIHIEQESVLR